MLPSVSWLLFTADMIYSSNRQRTQSRLSDHVSDHASDHAHKKIIEYCKTPKSRAEIQSYLGYKHRSYFTKNILNPLIESGQLLPTIPDNPKNQYQKYVAVQ